jgi:LysR family hca operon transcriptional activator
VQRAKKLSLSLVASTGGIALMPVYALNLLPHSVVSRPLAGVSPTIGLSLGYNEANTSPLLRTLVGKIGDLERPIRINARRER